MPKPLWKQKCRYRNPDDDHPCKAWAQPGSVWCWAHNPDQRARLAHGRLRQLEQGAAQARARLRRIEQERRVR